MNSDESIEDSQSVKRVYRPCGSTPNKPLGKKPRNFRGEGSTSRKGLHFSPKPSRRQVSFCPPLKTAYSPKQLTFNPKGKRRPWTKAETAALVQYVALHKDQQATEKEWPSMQHTNIYWTNAATFVQDAVDTSYLRQALSVRQRVQNHISKQFKTISEAEDAFGLDVDMYIEGTSKDLQEMEPIHPPQNVMEALDHLHESQLLQVLHSLVVSNKLCPKKVVEKIAGMLKTIRGTNMHVILLDLLASLELTVRKEIANKLFLNQAEEMGLDTNPADFVTLSLTAMRELQLKKKNNLVYKFCECIGKTRPGNSEPLMALNRMPFGLIEYNIEFFTCTNVHQIQEPSDYKLWLQTMDTEFPSRFKRLFAGPMWSGCESKDVGYPLKAKVNIARTSLKTQWERGKQSSENKVVSSAIQVENLKMMKQSNPDGRYWIKLDATDVKSGLMESMKCVWVSQEPARQISYK